MKPLRERVVRIAADARDVAVLHLELQPTRRLAEWARPECHPRHIATIQPARPSVENQAAATRSRSASRTTGHSSSTTLYQAESRFWPPRTSMCLRWMPSNAAGSPASAGPGALVERVRLELDATAAEDVERVLQLEELGLRVRAGAPCRRCQPCPADLEAPVLGSQREEPGRADGASRGDEHRGERQIEPVGDAVERIVHPAPATRRGSVAGRSAATARPAGRAMPPRGRRRAAAPTARAARSGPRASV